jgi:hypothetical protein
MRLFKYTLFFTEMQYFLKEPRDKYIMYKKNHEISTLFFDLETRPLRRYSQGLAIR